MSRAVSSIIITEQLGHLGLIAGMINELDLVKKIDERLPISKAHGAHLTMGQRVAVIIINGLGFLNDRLYLSFLKKKRSLDY